MQLPSLLFVIACLFGSVLAPANSAIAEEKNTPSGKLGMLEFLFKDKVAPKKEHPFIGRIYAQFDTNSYLLCVGVLVSRELVMTALHCGHPTSASSKLDELVVSFQTSPPTVVVLGTAIEESDKYGYAIYPIAEFDEGSPTNLVPAQLIKADLYKEGYVTTYDGWARPNDCRWKMAAKFLNKKLPVKPDYTSECRKRLPVDLGADSDDFKG
jgi:hypothetical protein